MSRDSPKFCGDDARLSADGPPQSQSRLEMREREELHRLACEAGRTGSWYVRLDTQECILSPMAAALFGLPAQEITLSAQEWRNRVDSTDLGGLESVVGSAIQRDVPFDFEFRATRANGTEYWLYVRGAVLRDESNKPVRVHGAVVDLTEQRRAKDELRRLNETLEQCVAERTEELLKAQDALRQSQKLEAMGQLTGGIAHDFNNLLTPIIANLDLLQQSPAHGEREKRLIDGALQSADLARTLVQRLLAFARRQPLHSECVDVGELIAGMAELVARTSGPQIVVKIDLGDDLQPSRADPNQLQMAILNLSVNARDAMPAGGTLTLSAVNETIGPDHHSKIDPGSYVRVAIVDTGIGMDEATLSRAVEPFFSTKPVGEGTGLGLSMVHGLASQMGGALHLSSRPGVGTTAEFWLPVWNGPTETIEPASVGARPTRPSGTALLVDDHDLVRMSTAEMLAELGYEVVEASSGEQAAELLKSGLRVDLLVTDHLMAGMTGAELARIAQTRSPQMPVLLISGYSDPGGLPPELPCLPKPFRKRDLEVTIDQLMAHACRRRNWQCDETLLNG
jgi:PAS domain S-box-containing protein